MDETDCIILGAGASGLMAAGLIKNKKVLLIEGNRKAGLKLLASGGGLCNFFNADLSFKNYQSQNPHFCISALSSYKLTDFLDFLKRYKVKYTQRPDGKYFAESSQSVLKALLEEIPQHTQIIYNTKFENAVKIEQGFEVRAGGKNYKSKFLICALGGLSYPALGASNGAFNLAENFGHTIIKTYPALCGINFTGVLKKQFADTAGITLEQAEITCGKKSFKGGLLFTHQGLSGPALFNLSLYGIKDKQITINFLPEINVQEYLKQHKSAKMLSTVLGTLIPPRLDKALACGIDKKTADMTKTETLAAAQRINAFTFTAQTPCGYKKAEITAGGISVKEVSSKTMMSALVPNLYFTGECLDITGQLGGYNLAWAWASAAAAAADINSK